MPERRKWTVAVVVALTLAAGPAGGVMPEEWIAEEAPPLEALVAEALERQPALAAAEARERAARERIGQARAWPAPQVALDFYQVPVRRPNLFTENLELDYIVSQEFPFPGKTGARAAVEEARWRRAGADRRELDRHLIADVKRAYYELWSVQQHLRVHAGIEEIVDAFVATAEAMYAQGLMGLEGLARARAELARLNTEHELFLEDYERGLADLNALLDRAPGELLGQIPTPAEASVPADLGALEEAMLDARADLEAVRLEAEIAAAEHDRARAEGRPDFMVRLMYKQMLESGIEDFYAAMVGVRIPLAPWSRSAITQRQTEAELAREASRRELDARERRARADLRRARLEARSRERSLRLFETDLVPRAEEAAEAALAAFRAGRTGYLMALDSLEALEEARLGEIAARARFHQALAELERQVGRPLSKDGES